MMEHAPNSHLLTFPILVVQPVQWGDQDAFGHVNNTIYLRWFESGRVAYFDRIGLSEMMRQSKIGPILASLTCNYRRQVTYPDQVRIGTRVSRIGHTSLTLEHRITSDSGQSIVTEGTSTIVAFDYAQNRPVPVPEALRREIALLEGRTF